MRRPETRIALIAMADVILGGLFLGTSAFGLIAQLLGGISAAIGVKGWCAYWHDRDEYEAWRRRSRR